MRLLTTAFISTLLSSSALAAPNVVVSIKPVHSLVTNIMEGVATPYLLIDGASSPHTFTLKPSQASKLQESDIVFWVGHSLETFLEKPLETIAADAKSVELMDTRNIVELEFREDENFEAHNHDDHEGHDNHDHAKHEDHDDHDHGKDKEHKDHDHSKHEDHDDHDHAKKEKHDDHDHAGETNPHIWLDPQNAIAMANYIAEELSEIDQENAKTYASNAQSLIAKLGMLDKEISGTFENGNDARFMVFHDAYPYFENRYGISASGSITLSPEVAPSAKRVKELQEKMTSANITCIFSEPQFDPKLVTVVSEGLEVKTGILDPLGSDFDAGSEQYFQTLRTIASNFLETCGS